MLSRSTSSKLAKLLGKEFEQQQQQTVQPSASREPVRLEQSAPHADHIFPIFIFSYLLGIAAGGARKEGKGMDKRYQR